MYYNYCDCNNFSNLVCPLCKTKNLVFYKTYERNLSFLENDKVINIKVSIIVCKCNHCAKFKDKQKYHAILPEFILPYHIYEASTIIKTINDRLHSKKIKEIIERLQITHKLFYDWLKKITKYTLSSSIVLKTKNELKTVVTKIMKYYKTFLNNFYDNYYHPFFLFRKTCIQLCIIP